VVGPVPGRSSAQCADAPGRSGDYLSVAGGLEAGDPELAAVKGTRSRVEYYWTATSALLCQIIKRQPDIGLLTYLDADLYFFSSPLPLYRELAQGSVLIVGHRFAPAYRYLESIAGRYNVGLLMFRADERGQQVLDWWRARCLEWCYDRPEHGKYGDQKYLDEWPDRFPGVVVSQLPGAAWAVEPRPIPDWLAQWPAFDRRRSFHFLPLSRHPASGSELADALQPPGHYPLDTGDALRLYGLYARALRQADRLAARLNRAMRSRGFGPPTGIPSGMAWPFRGTWWRGRCGCWSCFGDWPLVGIRVKC